MRDEPLFILKTKFTYLADPAQRADRHPRCHGLLISHIFNRSCGSNPARPATKIQDHVGYTISDQFHVGNNLYQRRAIVSQCALHGFDKLTLSFDPHTKTTAILGVDSEIRIEQ